MIGFLLANRTFAECAAAAVLILAGYLAWIHHDATEQKIGETVCEQRVTETRAQADAVNAGKLAAWTASQVQPAEAEHAKDLAAIPTRVVTTALWVRSATGPVCPGALPDLPGTAGEPASAGGALAGSGERDIRGSIEAFKSKYEAVIADCRELQAEWPR